jgi:hypothetical protein
MLASVARTGQGAVHIMGNSCKNSSHLKQRTTDERRECVVVIRPHPYSCLCFAAPQGVGQVLIFYDGDWSGMRHDGAPSHSELNGLGLRPPTRSPSYNEPTKVRTEIVSKQSHPDVATTATKGTDAVLNPFPKRNTQVHGISEVVAVRGSMAKVKSFSVGRPGLLSNGFMTRP